MDIIAAFGQLANGKDTICDYLAEALNKGIKKKSSKWERTAFANAVKDVFCSAFNVDRAFIEEWKRNPENPPGMIMPVRQSLQMIGDGFRKVKPDIWIDIALRKDNNKIISDGRYINEAKAVKEKGGINILIYREGFLNDDKNPSEAELKPLAEYCKDTLADGKIVHSTLVRYPDGLNQFDLFLRNDGKVEDLYAKIDKLVIPFINSKLK
jgi:hypothetical protein